MPKDDRSFLRRHRVIATITMVLLVAIGWIAFEVVRAVTARPGKPGQFAGQVERVVAEAQAWLPEPDAWQDFVRAVEAVKASEQAVLGKRGVRVSGRTVPGAPEDWPAGVSWPPDSATVGTDAAHGMVDAFFRDVSAQMEADGSAAAVAGIVAPRRAVRPIPTGKFIEVQLPELGASRAAARINHARMMFALEDGRLDALVGVFEQTLAIGRLVGSQATLIDHLVAVAIRSLAFNDVRYMIAQGLCDRATLAGILGAMDRQLPEPSLEIALETERLGISDTLRWTHTEDGRAMPSAIKGISGDLNAGVPSLGGLENVLWVFLPTREQSQVALDEYFALVGQEAALPAYLRPRPPPSEAFVENLPRTYLLVKLLVPSISRALLIRSGHVNDTQALRTMMALEMFRLDKGAYPASIDELVPEYLSKKPVDQFSGQGLQYVVKDAHAKAAADAYVLYSPGQDLIDNGGLPSPAGPIGEDGMDVVYNLRRPSTKPPQGD